MLRRGIPVLLFVVACSSPETIVQPSRAEVVAALEATGVSGTVAECVVGLAADHVDMSDLDPRTPSAPGSQLVVEEYTKNCEEAEWLNRDTFDQPPALAFAGAPDVFGDDRGLDELWLWCEAGDGSACDELWEIAPVGSSYERFGVTCGERPEILNCTEELVVDPAVTIDLSRLDPDVSEEGEGEESGDGDGEDEVTPEPDPFFS